MSVVLLHTAKILKFPSLRHDLCITCFEEDLFRHGKLFQQHRHGLVNFLLLQKPSVMPKTGDEGKQTLVQGRSLGN